MKRIYLDHNATAPLRPECKNILDEWGNGSSIHGRGRRVRALIESARSRIAAFLDVPPRGIIFTSGATESNNLILKSHKGPVITSLLEHPSVLKARSDAHLIPIMPSGLIDMEKLEEALSTHQNALVSLTSANSETGVIQPIQEAVALTQKHGHLFHTDAVQAYSRTPIPYSTCHYITLSGHKIGGFQGIGILYAHSDAPLSPLHQGGGQEYGLRAGTENLIGIRSLALAMEEAENDPWNTISIWRNDLEKALLNIPGTISIVPQGVKRLANTLLISRPGTPSTTLVMKLDLAGFEVSAGSACHSGKVRSTGLLEAMNISRDIQNSIIRISIPYNATHEDILTFQKTWANLSAG